MTPAGSNDLNIDDPNSDIRNQIRNSSPPDNDPPGRDPTQCDQTDTTYQLGCDCRYVDVDSEYGQSWCGDGDISNMRRGYCGAPTGRRAIDFSVDGICYQDGCTYRPARTCGSPLTDGKCYFFEHKLGDRYIDGDICHVSGNSPLDESADQQMRAA